MRCSGLYIWSARDATQGTVSEMGAFVLHPRTQAYHQLDADSDSVPYLSYLLFLVRIVNSIRYFALPSSLAPIALNGNSPCYEDEDPEINGGVREITSGVLLRSSYSYSIQQSSAETQPHGSGNRPCHRGAQATRGPHATGSLHTFLIQDKVDEREGDPSTYTRANSNELKSVFNAGHRRERGW